MKICVIGGCGFIGINLCKRLLSTKHEVLVLDQKVSTELKAFDLESKIRWFTGDYKNPELLKKAIEGCDVLFHLASNTVPGTAGDDPVFDIESNLITSIRLIEAAKHASVSKIIYVSSGGTVYGVPEYIPIDEKHVQNPICSYGITKLATEKYLSLYNRTGGPSYIVFRLSNPYGPYQNPESPQGVIPVFIKKVLSDQKLEIWGDGSVIRDFIYIDDVIDVFVNAIDSSEGNNIYNLGSGEGTSIKEIFEAVEKVCDKKADIEYKSSRAIDVPVNVLDIDVIRKVYQWQPKISLETGLVKTMTYIKKFIAQDIS